MKKLLLPLFNLLFAVTMLAINAYTGDVTWTIVWSAMLIVNFINLMFHDYIGKAK